MKAKAPAKAQTAAKPAKLAALTPDQKWLRRHIEEFAWEYDLNELSKMLEMQESDFQNVLDGRAKLSAPQRQRLRDFEAEVRADPNWLAA